MRNKDKDEAKAAKAQEQQQLEEPSAIIEMDVPDTYQRSPSPYPPGSEEDITILETNTTASTSGGAGGNDNNELFPPPNHYEMQQFEFMRNSPARLTKIYLGEINDAADLDQLESHHEFYVLPKTTGSSSSPLIKITNKEGNHIFSCNIKRLRNICGCPTRGDKETRKEDKKDASVSKNKKKVDYSYRLMDTQGLKLVTGKLSGRIMEARTALKNSLGLISKNSWSSKYLIKPNIGQELWSCVPKGGCCLFACGLKSFEIINCHDGSVIGTMKRDPTTRKFLITMPNELTIGNKGLLLLTGLMIYDQYFSETSCDCGGCSGGVYNAKCCCCMIFAIIVTLILLAVLSFLIVYFTRSDEDDKANADGIQGWNMNNNVARS